MQYASAQVALPGRLSTELSTASVDKEAVATAGSFKRLEGTRHCR